jgi:hypothetical protein
MFSSFGRRDRWNQLRLAVGRPSPGGSKYNFGVFAKTSVCTGTHCVLIARTQGPGAFLRKRPFPNGLSNSVRKQGTRGGECQRSAEVTLRLLGKFKVSRRKVCSARTGGCECCGQA